MSNSSFRAFAYRPVHEHLRTVIDRAHEAVVTVQEDLSIVAFNRGAEQLFGYPRSEVLGQSLSMLLPPEARDEHDARVAEFIRSAGRGEDRPMGIRGAIRGMRRDGSEFEASASIYASCEHGIGCGTAILVDRHAHQRSMESLELLLRQNQQLARQLVENEELERRRLAEKLHDDVAQWATALNMRLSLFQRELPCLPERARTCLKELQSDISRAQGLIEDQVRRVRPAALDQVGLHGAVEDLIKRLAMRECDMTVSLNIDPAVDRVDDTTRTTAYRILREALTNTARHARADAVCVAAQAEPADCPEELVLCVEDDGVGPSQQPPERGLGLNNIMRRAQAIGGEVRIDRGATGGFSLNAVLPLADNREHGK